MALNQYMHERNIYRNPPDFSELAMKYIEFMEVSKLDLNGKVRIDFRDPKALRVLTKCLLHQDFNLDVNIPEDRLVPTLPLRLNYLLWIEDLLTICKRSTDIIGVDIGTGACAIYPLLAAKKNNWKMYGTESDAISLKLATENIERNNLSNLITLVKSINKALLNHLFEDKKDLELDFCMCNPPFYSSIEELFESRSPARPPPKNAFTGSPQELITEGGEIEFINKMIAESQELKGKIRIYTTMIGHKHTLKSLIEMLKAEGIHNFTHTEFCQGRTTRWGLAWTFVDSFNLSTTVPPRKVIRKKNLGMCFTVPRIESKKYDVKSVADAILEILKTIELKPEKFNRRGSKRNMEFKAFENTWSNQRKRRRMMKFSEANTKKVKIDDNSEHTINQCVRENNNTEDSSKGNVIADAVDETDAIVRDKGMSEHSEDKAGSNSHLKVPILQFLMCLSKSDENVVMELTYVSGNAGKEGLHQILQYIKNNWK